MTDNRINAWEIIPIRSNAGYAQAAASWFHDKWGIPKEEYLKSINSCIDSAEAVPQWYLLIDNRGDICGGAGLIDNDFHKRRDLTPNVCALYIEQWLRGKGLAKTLLNHICRDAAEHGIEKLYLITDHVGFYERCGWHFLCMIEDNNAATARMYERTTGSL